ncbi:hypothetical protein [Stenotrophomonas daejeonensis]|uniref:hypothetical protein n=1 Tax=Stenotrophomonas daejeonensis TaxID=659018 RepID=UPI00128EB7AF|nr:hypothetical protein [Stenotrophomonas daejeonensis]
MNFPSPGIQMDSVVLEVVFFDVVFSMKPSRWRLAVGLECNLTALSKLAGWIAPATIQAIENKEKCCFCDAAG